MKRLNMGSHIVLNKFSHKYDANRDNVPKIVEIRSIK